jgi:hypothetical protein
MIFARLFFPQLCGRSLPCVKGKRGPDAWLSDSEIMTIVVMYHLSRFRDLKTFYRAYVQKLWRSEFPDAPCYERFIALQGRVLVPLTMFLSSNMGKKSGIYYVDSTSLPVCHNKRISRHKTFAGLAARGKTSMGWFFGFKLHIIFNDQREIVALKITRGNVSDAKVLPELSHDLAGKIFGDKGYLGKKLAEELMKRGLALMTRVRKNMKALPITMTDKMLLNARNIAETIIGNIKEFSGLNLPKHRSVTNAFLHIIAALTSYQLNPLKPKLQNKRFIKDINP